MLRKITVGLLVMGALLLMAIFVLPRDDRSPSGLSWPDVEVRTLSVAVERYKIDCGHYPNAPGITDKLEPNRDFDSDRYVASSAFLYLALAGEKGEKQYFNFNDKSTPAMLKKSAMGTNYIVDPWGNSFGYSTFASKHPDNPGGNNPTFDLWSTGGSKIQKDQSKWFKNW